MKEHLRILKFSASNVKRLGVVQVDIRGNVVKISGANGSGKTSVLDCIEYALCGTSNVPSQVIRRGKHSAVIQLDLGKVVVTRRFFDSGRTTIQILSKSDRSEFKSPQTLLDALMAKVSFDPLEFIRMEAKKQAAVLRQLLGLDFDELDKEYNRDYATRREIRKEYGAIEVRRDAVYVQADLPLERRDEEALTAEMAEVAQFNQSIDAEIADRERVKVELQALIEVEGKKKQLISELTDEIQRLKKLIKNDQDSIAIHEAIIAEWKPLPERKNARELAEQLNAARIVNAAIGRREQRDALQAEIDALKQRHEALSEALDANRAQRTAAIESAKFPIDGLGFGEDEVLWQGLPFNQISNADQIRTSVAIGMAMNPSLRVMRIKDGSLLDSKSMEIVEGLANANDFQVWIEVVDESGKVGIYLEEGEIKAINEDDAEAPDEPKRDMRLDLPMPGETDIEPLEVPPLPERKKRTRKAKQ